jgi:hypothetical protein
MTGVVHGWLDADSAGKPLLTKVGITAAPVDLWHEFFWWVVDEYYVTIVKELAATAGGTPQTTTKEMDDLKSEIRGAQGDLSKALAPGLPKGAAESDIAALRPAILKALKDDGRTFGNVDAGFFRQRLDRMRHPDVVAFRREVRATASRKVSAFAETSTILARPFSSKCVSFCFDSAN